MVTLMGRFPFSAKYSAMVVSKMRQLVLEMTLAMPSWMLLGLASHVSFLSRPTNSSLYLIVIVHEDENTGLRARD